VVTRCYCFAWCSDRKQKENMQLLQSLCLERSQRIDNELKEMLDTITVGIVEFDERVSACIAQPRKVVVVLHQAHR
jgi:hypothetical protein